MAVCFLALVLLSGCTTPVRAGFGDFVSGVVDTVGNAVGNAADAVSNVAQEGAGAVADVATGGWDKVSGWSEEAWSTVSEGACGYHCRYRWRRRHRRSRRPALARATPPCSSLKSPSPHAPPCPQVKDTVVNAYTATECTVVDWVGIDFDACWQAPPSDPCTDACKASVDKLPQNCLDRIMTDVQETGNPSAIQRLEQQITACGKVRWPLLTSPPGQACLPLCLLPLANAEPSALLVAILA